MFGSCNNRLCEYSFGGKCECPRSEWLCEERANAWKRFCEEGDSAWKRFCEERDEEEDSEEQ